MPKDSTGTDSGNAMALSPSGTMLAFGGGDRLTRRAESRWRSASQLLNQLRGIASAIAWHPRSFGCKLSPLL
jgi:hypothetical protein